MSRWVPGALAATALWAAVASGIALHEHSQLSQGHQAQPAVPWQCQSPANAVKFQQEYPTLGFSCP